MNREGLDRLLERGILALVLGMLVFAPLATAAVGTWEFLVVQGLAMGVMAFWLIRVWLNPKTKFLWPPACWLVVAFVGYAVYRYLTCDIEYAGRRELIRAVVYAFVFLAIINNLHRQEHTQIITFTLIFLATAIGGYAIFQFVTRHFQVWTYPSVYPGRASGTFISPNHLAGFLEMLLPLALAYLIAGRVRPVTRILLGYASVVLLVAIGTTLSRGGYVACGAGLLMLFGILTLYRTHRLPAILALVVLIGGGYFLVSKSMAIKHRLRTGTESSATKQEVLDVRYSLWQAAYRMWRAHPLVGIGPGHFNYGFPQYRSEHAQHRPDYAHNDYLNTLADWGGIGAGLVVLFLIVVFAGAVKCWPYICREESDFRANRSNKFAFVLGSVVALGALLVHSFLDFNMQIPANALLAVSLAALLSGHLRFATEGYWFSARWGTKGLVSVALVAGLAWLGGQEFRGAKEYSLLRQASQWPDYSTGQLNAFKSAAAAEPTNFETTFTLAEMYQALALEGGETYEELAKEAIAWYERGMRANPYDALNYVGAAKCLDFMGRFPEAEKLLHRAEELDPNGFLTANAMGWHFMQQEKWIAAKAWLERSRRLEWITNTAAEGYLAVVYDRLATSMADRLGAPAKPAE